MFKEFIKSKRQRILLAVLSVIVIVILAYAICSILVFEAGKPWNIQKSPAEFTDATGDITVTKNHFDIPIANFINMLKDSNSDENASSTEFPLVHNSHKSINIDLYIDRGRIIMSEADKHCNLQNIILFDSYWKTDGSSDPVMLDYFSRILAIIHPTLGEDERDRLLNAPFSKKKTIHYTKNAMYFISTDSTLMIEIYPAKSWVYDTQYLLDIGLSTCLRIK